MKLRYGYSGVHMFDRKSGLNVLMDEVSVPVDRWSAAPRYMSFALTNACELACSYCYASKAPARLSHDHIIAWAIDLDRNGCFGVGFGGGEPTLFPEFARLCREVHSSTALAITMTTHGHRFNDALVNNLTGFVEFIRLSMDGIDTTYTRLRGRPFAEFQEKLALVRATSRFGINYVVNPDTIADLPRAADFAFENGAEEFLLLPETGSGGTVSVGPEVIRQASKWVNENYQRCRLATSAHGGECLDAPMLLSRDVQHESYDFLHVDAFGNLKKSAFSNNGVALAAESSIIEGINKIRNNNGVEVQ